jgi:hypothetical protein
MDDEDIGGSDDEDIGGMGGRFALFFRKEASAFRPLFYWTFGPFLNPIF